VKGRPPGATLVLDFISQKANKDCPNSRPSPYFCFINGDLGGPNHSLAVIDRYWDRFVEIDRYWDWLAERLAAFGKTTPERIN
jgi:hypothetical protein